MNKIFNKPKKVERSVRKRDLSEAIGGDHGHHHASSGHGEQNLSTMTRKEQIVF